LTPLGYTIPPAEVSRQAFGAGTQQAVQDFQRKHGLTVSGIVDPQTARLINIAFNARKQRTVSGHVSYPGATSLPLSGLIVRALNGDLRNERKLGEATTDAAGLYQITYTPDRLLRKDKSAVDLMVRAFSPEGILITASATVFGAPDPAVIDLT